MVQLLCALALVVYGMSTTTALILVCAHCMRCCFILKQEESDFLDPLREQLGYLASAKEVHRGRGRALDALQVSVGVRLMVRAGRYIQVGRAG